MVGKANCTDGEDEGEAGRQIQEKVRDMSGLAIDWWVWPLRNKQAWFSNFVMVPLLRGPHLIGSLPAQTGSVLDATIQEESN